MTELTQGWRYRINVSKTSTGKYSFDCTVEGTGYPDMFDVLERSDLLVQELEERYGAKEAIKEANRDG